jgi:hypothetical protein
VGTGIWWWEGSFQSLNTSSLILKRTLIGACVGVEGEGLALNVKTTSSGFWPKNKRTEKELFFQIWPFRLCGITEPAWIYFTSESYKDFTQEFSLVFAFSSRPEWQPPVTSPAERLLQSAVHCVLLYIVLVLLNLRTLLLVQGHRGFSYIFLLEIFIVLIYIKVYSPFWANAFKQNKIWIMIFPQVHIHFLALTFVEKTNLLGWTAFAP